MVENLHTVGLTAEIVVAIGKLEQAQSNHALAEGYTEFGSKEEKQ